MMTGAMRGDVLGVARRSDGDDDEEAQETNSSHRQQHPSSSSFSPLSLSSYHQQRTTTTRTRTKATGARQELALVLLRFGAASIVAVAVTVACPGDTKLWRRHDADDDRLELESIQYNVLVPILVSFAATLLLFVRVVHSDPGYVVVLCTRSAAESMERMNHEHHDDAACHRRETTIEDAGGTSMNDTSNSNPQRSVEGGMMVNAAQHPSDPTDDDDDDDDRHVELSSLLPSTPHLPTRPDGEEEDALDRRRAATRLLNDLSPSGSQPAIAPAAPENLQQRRQQRRRPYCPTCRVAPPLRAHHCRTCNKCVATFDHHCPLIGNCVGERNRALFVAYLIVQAVGSVLCAQVVLSSQLGLVTLVFDGSVGRTRTLQAWQVVVTEFYVLPIAGIAFVMALAHVLMVLCNITTFEIAKSHHLEYMQLYDVTDCPFSSGPLTNVWRTVQLGCEHNDNGNCHSWLPYEWELPSSSTPSTHASADWWNHLWRNQYWSCC